jgi:hypothetical protein
MSSSREAAEPETRVASLRMNTSTDKVWLMKVPQFFMDHLQVAAAAGETKLGTVTPMESKVGAGGSSSSSTSTPAGASSSYRLTLSTMPEGKPREFDMRFSAAPPATYLLSHETEGSTPPVHHGRFDARGEIRPTSLSAEYRGILETRRAAAAPQRTMATIEDDKLLKQEKLGHTRVQREERLDKDRKIARREHNAAKKDKVQLTSSQIKERLKELFVKVSHWTRRDMVAEIGNERELSAVLEELCDKITKRGPLYGEYVLKAEFRA